MNRYLLVKYAEEPFLHEYSEQDLYTNIRGDIYSYEPGKLDVTVKNHYERWQRERAYFSDLYIEKCRNLNDFEKHIVELEEILTGHSLKSSRMAKQKTEKKNGLLPFK
ncbi:MAG: hypothetical protein P9M03_07600 [Candidatus Theseobacter exili]|nr:hypothetical protein [Candidatus Theseobacter exili]